MSAAMDSYPAEVDGHVLATHGVVVVANNPGRLRNGDSILPAFVFGQPKRTAMHVAGPTADPVVAAYVVVFEFGDEQWRCIPFRDCLTDS